MAKAKNTTTESNSTDAEKQALNPANLRNKTDSEVTIQESESFDDMATETTSNETESNSAKAGKRSAKAQAATEAKEAKEARKVLTEEEQAEADARPKQAVKPTRPRLERQGKKLQEVAKLIDRTKLYTLKEALELARKTSPVKFDASVEIHVNLNVDPRHADQNIRDNLVLPAGTGRKVRVAVFDDAYKPDTADSSDINGVETITKQLDKGEINFDILIATPAQMPKLGKYARTLGPRGLMPNPKSGTVTSDVAKAVKEAKAGRVEYRVDSTGIVHLLVGKASFSAANLLTNVQAVLASIKANKPASVKGSYVKAVHLTTSMGPSIPVAVSEV